MQRREGRTRPTGTLLAAAVASCALLGAGAPAAHAAGAAHPVTIVVTTPAGASVEEATTMQTVRDQFAGMAKYWSDQSAGRVDFQLAKLDWWPGHGTCGNSANAAVDAAKQEAGFVSGAGKHIVSVVAGCPSSGGVGTVGSGLDSGGWVSMERPDWSGTWTHEFGHNIGFSHANLLGCPGTAIDGEPTEDGGVCTRGAYGDILDTMGTSRRTSYKGLSTPSMIRTGMLGASDFADVDSTAPVDRTVTIQSRDLLTGLRSVRVKDPRSGRVYFAELTSSDTYDAGIISGGDEVKTLAGLEYRQNYGVRVLRADGKGTFLLATPPDAAGTRRTTWAVGQAFTSASGGTTISVVGATRTTATLRIRTQPVGAPVDTTAPAVPGGLTATATTGSVAVSWTANTDGDLAGYRLLRDGTQIATPGTVTTFTDTGVTAGSTYRYTLRAVDTTGNVSADSAAATATVPAPPPPAPDPVTSGGTYRIVSAASGKLIDVPGSTRTAGTQLIQFADNGGGANQRWTLTAGAGGVFAIKNGASGLCIGVNRGSVADGAAIIQAGCNRATDQRWTLVPSGSGYQLVAKHSGKCLTVPGGATANSVGLTQAKCTAAAGQRWTFASSI